MSISRTTLTDDSGDNLSGTIWNNARLQAVYDAVESNWSADTYTPTWGNTGTSNTTTGSTIGGSYFKIGKLVYFRITLTWGSGTASGNGAWTFTLPFTAADSVGVNGACNAIYSDAGTLYKGTGVSASTTTIQMLSNASPLTSVSATVPFTWANGDAVYVTGIYIAA